MNAPESRESTGSSRRRRVRSARLVSSQANSDSSCWYAGGFGRTAHSVLTLEVREVDGQPAYEARKRVVEFLKERLT